MPRIRITKKFSFEMAHALYGYDGICRNIHGHSYSLEITIAGEPMSLPGHPKDGMVMDFHELKMLVKQHVTSKFDHALLVNSQTSEEQVTELKKITGRLMLVEFQPTTENMLCFIADMLRDHLPSNVSLFSLRLYETGSSYAEWFASDNP
jgi:6-pyruvoyltetrahydropterin/6-carboxytetrahydropterin synthase